MKRNYQKPDIFFEDFALSSNIANSCSLANHSTTCSIHGTTDGRFIYDGFSFFSGELGSSCDFGPQDDVGFNICYDVPSDDSRMFVS